MYSGREKLNKAFFSLGKKKKGKAKLTLSFLKLQIQPIDSDCLLVNWRVVVWAVKSSGFWWWRCMNTLWFLFLIEAHCFSELLSSWSLLLGSCSFSYNIFCRLEANAGALTNFEVLDFLRSRGAGRDPTRVIVPVAPSEFKVGSYIIQLLVWAYFIRPGNGWCLWSSRCMII